MDGLDHAHGLDQVVLGLDGVLQTFPNIHSRQLLLMTFCCMVDFDVDGLDHDHGIDQAVLGVDGVLQTFQSILDNLY